MQNSGNRVFPFSLLQLQWYLFYIGRSGDADIGHLVLNIYIRGEGLSEGADGIAGGHTNWVYPRLRELVVQHSVQPTEIRVGYIQML